jgi:uncharacterized NAD(P)/FAD-binding protein YdhS
MGPESEATIQGNIAIVGGGYSGSMLAVELLRRAGGNISVILVERRPLPGRGVAYSTQFEGHLLNVRARNMSAYAAIPNHFVEWAQRNYSASVRPNDFLPRTIYGQYISSQLREAIRASKGSFRCIQGEAISLTCSGTRSGIRLVNGQTVLVDKVVLALGNFPPSDLRIHGKTVSGPRFISNPWSPNALIDTPRDNRILLIGSGLTSVDTALELRARGFEGTLHIVSRHGLLPQRHAAIPFQPFQLDQASRTTHELLKLVRARVKEAEATGSNWRAVIDSLRPITQPLWRALPVAEKQRFLRHLRSYWDVHRHRIAERIADQLSLQLRTGQMQMHAGRIIHYHEGPEGVDITYRLRNRDQEKTLHVDRVVNCTGPDGDLRHVDSPLIRDILSKQLARPDELSLGLDVAQDGSVIDGRGVISDLVYALGPLRKGKLWESVAVPELRVQVAELATLLVTSLQAETGSIVPARHESFASMHL